MKPHQKERWVPPDIKFIFLVLWGPILLGVLAIWLCLILRAE